MGTLARQLEDLRERIEEQSQRPDAASRAKVAMAGDLGEGIAHLDIERANKAFEAITRIEAKIDDLGTRIDCSSATPAAMRIAIKAHVLDRVVSMWRCRPENATTFEVQQPIAYMFSKREFSGARAFLDGLVAAGLNPTNVGEPIHGIVTKDVYLPYLYHPIYHALAGNGELNLDGVRWLVDNAPGESYWKKYSIGTLLGAMKLTGVASRNGIDEVVEALSLLRMAGVPLDERNYAAFRNARRNWIESQIPDELRVGIPSVNIRGERLEALGHYEIGPDQAEY
jgi:hypothetical protein